MGLVTNLKVKIFGTSHLAYSIFLFIKEGQEGSTAKYFRDIFSQYHTYKYINWHLKD